MKKTQYFIGIDLHKTVIQVCVVNKAGEIDEEFRQRLDEPDAIPVTILDDCERIRPAHFLRASYIEGLAPTISAAFSRAVPKSLAGNLSAKSVRIPRRFFASMASCFSSSNASAAR